MTDGLKPRKMKKYFRIIGISLWIWIAVLFSAYGCKSAQRIGDDNGLSQNKILNDLIDNAPYDMSSKKLSKYASRNSPQMAYLWLVDPGVEVSEDDIIERLTSRLAGGYLTCWKITSPDMHKVCYMRAGLLGPFPVTPKGIRLNLSRYFSGVDESLEDIYMIEGDSVVCFGREDFKKLRIKDDAGVSLTIHFPKNTSGSMRFWQLRYYYTDPYQYDRDDVAYDRAVGTTKRPWGQLNFLQLTDTVYSEAEMTRICKDYEKMLPSPVKSRHPERDEKE